MDFVAYVQNSADAQQMLVRNGKQLFRQPVFWNGLCHCQMLWGVHPSLTPYYRREAQLSRTHIFQNVGHRMLSVSGCQLDWNWGELATDIYWQPHESHKSPLLTVRVFNLYHWTFVELKHFEIGLFFLIYFVH